MQTTLKPKAATNKRPKFETEDEDSIAERDSLNDDSLLSNTPPSAKKQKKDPAPKKISGKPLQAVENESMNFDDPSESKSEKTATEKYQIISPREHILIRPDTYIGSIERSEQQMWVFNAQTEQMEYRMISFVPGLYKIFDEILVNAADNKQNDKNMKAIKVMVDREKGEISVENDGCGIPVEIHAVSILRFVVS